MVEVLTRFWSEDDGATAIEYALIAAMFAVVALLAAQHLGQQMSTTYNKISSAVSDASQGAGS